jgi:hypothetical protein
MTDPKDELLKTVIEEKEHHVEQIIAPRLDSLSARQDAYKRIVSMAKERMRAYYEAHPERATDARGKDAEGESIQGLRAIFDILDDYLISYRETKSPEALPTGSGGNNAT